MKLRLGGFLLVLLVSACTTPQKQEDSDQLPDSSTDYIRPIAGQDAPQDLELIKKGQVLISYGDCGNCHTDEKRAKGPAFRDIAKRYPSNEAYIELLAQKIIQGGFGSWGNPVMTPHPNLQIQDARAMVHYILSLE